MKIIQPPTYPLSFICFDKQAGEFLQDEALDSIPISEFFKKNPRYIALQGVGFDHQGATLYVYDIVHIALEDSSASIAYYIISIEGELYLEPLDSNKGRLKYYPLEAQELLTKQGSVLLIEEI
jgi:hypothetical protein